MRDAGDKPGIYQLHLLLTRPVRLQIGRLGRFRFPAGRYVYTGSALSGLERRLARHHRRKKRLHWHIDYLLRHASIEDVSVYPAGVRGECEVNLALLRQANARVVVPGFGSSDCRCPAHLIYLTETMLHNKPLTPKVSVKTIPWMSDRFP